MLDKKSNTLTPERLWTAVRPLLAMQLGGEAARLDHALVLEQQGNLWRVGVASEEDAHILNNGLNGIVTDYLGTAVGQPVMVEFLAVGPPPLWPEGRANGRVLPPADGRAAPGLTPQKAWQATLAELELQMTKATFNTWLKDTALVGQQDGVWTIGVRNEQAIEWLTSRLYDTIARTLAAVAGTAVTLAFVVEDGARVGGLNGRVPEEPEVPPLDDDVDMTSLTAPGPLPAPQDDQVQIDLIDDPVSSFLMTSHYAIRFWRPYLGLVPFTLWELLRSYGFFVRQYKAEWPTIAILSDSIGQGDRYTLLGREATASRPAQAGAVTRLTEENILKHVIRGSGKQTRHHFTVRDKLPMLTPAQMQTLTARKQKEHLRMLEKFYKEFDLPGWKMVTSATFVKPIR